MMPSSATDTFMSPVAFAPTRPSAHGAVERGGWTTRRLRYALSSWVYLPACSIAAVAVILLGVGWATDWGERILQVRRRASVPSWPDPHHWRVSESSSSSSESGRRNGDRSLPVGTATISCSQP